MDMVYPLILTAVQRHHLLTALQERLHALDPLGAHFVLEARQLLEVQHALETELGTTAVEWKMFREQYAARLAYQERPYSVMRVTERKSVVLATRCVGGAMHTEPMTERCTHRVAVEICDAPLALKGGGFLG